MWIGGGYFFSSPKGRDTIEPINPQTFHLLDGSRAPPSRPPPLCGPTAIFGGCSVFSLWHWRGRSFLLAEYRSLVFRIAVEPMEIQQISLHRKQRLAAGTKIVDQISFYASKLYRPTRLTHVNMAMNYGSLSWYEPWCNNWCISTGCCQCFTGWPPNEMQSRLCII